MQYIVKVKGTGLIHGREIFHLFLIVFPTSGFFLKFVLRLIALSLQIIRGVATRVFTKFRTLEISYISNVFYYFV